jgi:hypothetical protein
VDRLDRLAARLAVGVCVVRLDAHRARAIQREHRRDVLERVRPHRPQQGPHGTAVELEHAERVALRKQLEGRLVGERQRLEVDGLVAVGLDVGETVLDDGQVAQPEEVHLEQSQRLAAGLVELRDDGAVLLALHHRHDVHERFARHDDAGRVHAPLPLEVLELTRGVDDPLDVGVGLIQAPELSGLSEPRVLAVEDPAQRDVFAHHAWRHRLGDPVAHREGVAEDARRVLDRLLGLDGAVGDDLRDAVCAVLIGDVANDLAPPALVEIDVDIGHRHPLGVEEPLEEQAVLQRVEVGDA